MRQVLEANADIQDALDVAASVESLGWTDSRVEDVFGYASVFDLAEDMLQDIRQAVQTRPLPQRLAIPWRALLAMVAREVVHGMTFALPMAVSVLSMIILRISFSSYQYFSVEQATALALATFLSFVVTGGFSQAMANTYYLLVGLQQAEEVESTIFLLMRWGLWGAMGLAALLIALDSVFPLMPLPLVEFMALYLVLLSALWLAFSGLYVLRREYLLTLITAMAIAIAYLLWRKGFPVLIGQMVGMMTASVASVVTALVVHRKSSRKLRQQGRVLRTRMSQLAYATSSYFFYGLLYFLFIYADRLVAWSTNTVYMPYSIWFRGEYELGMDWSLAALILPLASAEVLVSSLMRWLQDMQQRTPERQAATLGRRFRAVYARALGIYVAVSLTGILGAHIAASLAQHTALLHAAVPTQGVEPFVFGWATWAYVLVAVALFNILLLFTLSFPAAALRSIVIAIGLDLGVGMVMTRLFGDYQFAVFGLFAGAAYLFVSSTLEVLRFLPRVDFLLYRIA